MSGLRRVDLATAEVVYDESDPEGFRAGLVRPGPGLGARRTGMSLYVLPPGQALCPYHYEYAEEEWLVVLEGQATVRHPGGTDVLGPSQAAFFATGPDGAHQVRNDSDGTVRVLMFSDVLHPAATVYPDSDKIGIHTGNPADDLMVRRSSGVGYFDGESR